MHRFSYRLLITFSIHASAKEATQLYKYVGYYKTFQSTPPRRRRHFVRGYIKGIVSFSIHASAKEATVLPENKSQNH